MQLEVIEKEIGQKISDFINEDSYSKEIHIYIRAPFSGTILKTRIICWIQVVMINWAHR